MEIACEMRCQLGEGPVWCASERALYWVDIYAPAVHRFSVGDRTVQTWAMPERIGWLVRRRDHPGFVAGFQSGFYELTLDPVERRLIVDPEPQLPGNRLNDAAVDPCGRLWAGTMDSDIVEVSGSLYRLDGDHSLHTMDTGYRVTNGPAFSPDGRYLYHNDTGRGRVYRFDLSVDGSLSNKTEFLLFPRELGSPDGMTVDADGGLWIAHWGGGRVTRFRPDASEDHSIELPASQITSCAFAGERLERLFVTSAAVDRDDEQYAGCLFEVDPGGACGLPGHDFAG